MNVHRIAPPTPASTGADDARIAAHAIPLGNIQPGQLFVPANEPDIICALLYHPDGTLARSADGKRQIVCIAAARSPRLVGLTAVQNDSAPVYVLELVSKATYVPAGRG